MIWWVVFATSHAHVRPACLSIQVLVDAQGMCYVWKIHSSSGSEATTLQPVTSFQAHPKYITRVLLSPDTRCAIFLPSSFFLSEQIQVLDCGLSVLRSGMPGLTTRHLATCSADSTIKIWSTLNYEYTLEKTLTGHQGWVWDAAFSADSAYLVTGE